MPSEPRAKTPLAANRTTPLARAFDALDDRSKQALLALSVFPSSFSLDAAEAMVGADHAIDELLDRLTDASLASRSTGEDAVERFSLDEGARVLAAELLLETGALDASLARHDAYFLELGRALAHRVDTFGDIHARSRLASELDSLLAVHARGLSTGDLPKALDALLALDPILQTQVSAQRRLDLWIELSGRLGRDTVRSIDVLAGVGRALAGAGRHEDARAHLEDAAKLAELASSARAAHLQIDLGLVFHASGALPAAREAYARALDLESRHADERLRARAWGNLGAVLHDERKLEGAKRNYERSLVHARAIGDARIEGIMLTNLGVLEQELRAYDRARSSLEGALRLLEPAGDRRLTAIAKSNLMTLLLECGELEAARVHGEAALEEQRAMGDRKSLVLVGARMAILFAMLGDAKRAQVELRAARGLAEELRDESASAVLDVAACFLPLASPQADREAIAAEVRLVAMTPIGDGDPPFDRSDEVRTMLRLAEGLASKPAEAAAEEERLVVSNACDAFLPHVRREKARLWRRLEVGSPAHRVFEALVKLRVDEPESGLSMEELAKIAWPSESTKVDGSSGSGGVRASRVYALVANLRQLGLAAMLLRRPGGYLLDSEVPVCFEDAPAAAPPKPKKARGD